MTHFGEQSGDALGGLGKIGGGGEGHLANSVQGKKDRETSLSAPANAPAAGAGVPWKGERTG
ncbi:hypothetical protein MyNCGM70_61250 [Achromobacter xylosoxidans]